MCGIVGYFNIDGSPVNEEMINNMLHKIHHRGPDDMGCYIKRDIGIGMKRLSIIDLTSGHQPISNEDNRLHIVFNGEIYNYIELRDVLQKKGHLFKTDSDTETILHLYEEYREECVTYLNGMFAFAIWDEVKRTIFCARDHLGIKPFYYYIDQNRLIFASELKALLEDSYIDRSLDYTALTQFLSFEFIPSPRTLIDSIKKLPPGHWLRVSGKGTRIEKYWRLEDITLSSRPVKDTEEELYSLLRDSVRLQIRSDVPFGAFLSGGIDSSTITAIMSELLGEGVKTFSIGFKNESYNELEYSREVSKRFNTDHTEYILEPSSIDLIERLIYHLDDPIGDFSIFPTYMVSKLAREKVKVILSGDGGDELFGGYDTYLAQKFYHYYQLIPRLVRENLLNQICSLLPPTEKKKGIINKIKRYVDGANLPLKYEHFRWMTFVRQREYDTLFTEETLQQFDITGSYSFITNYLNSAGDTGLNRSMFLDVKSYLVDNILVKVDRMSMAASLEARVPFLDRRVVELAFSMPDLLKIRGRTTKYILKKMAERLLPERVIYRQKQGFSIPMKNWLKGPVRAMMMDLLSYSRIQKQGIFNPIYIENLIKGHLENRDNHSHKLWGLMLFQLWYDRIFLNNAEI
ncbi:MAG: asparagine synthase (glutamine-hydrolyzing) [Nitrospirota bacterium]